MSKKPTCRVINKKCFFNVFFPLIKTSNELQILLPIQSPDRILKLSIDTGAQISILYPYKLDKSTTIDIDKSIQIQGIVQNSSTSSKGLIEADIYHEDLVLSHEFHIVKDDKTSNIDGILGHDFFKTYNACVNYQKNILKLQIAHRLSPQNDAIELEPSHVQSMIATSYSTDDYCKAVNEYKSFKIRK